MLDVLKNRVGMPEGSTVVVDRGMAYTENLTEIRQRNHRYVIAARQPERDQWLDQFEDPEGFELVLREPSPLNPFQKKSIVRVKSVRQGEELFVLCHSEERVAKDRAIREKQEQRFLADLERLQKRIEKGRLKREIAIGEAIGRLKEHYPRVSRYHTITWDATTRKLAHEPNADKKAKAELLDGGYLLRTDRTDLSAREAWLLYMTLTRAENAFRMIKTPLAERPIFHHLEHRVETHIFLCVLAYHLLNAIETTLLNQGVGRRCGKFWQPTRWRRSSCRWKGGKLLCICKGMTPEPEHLELYRLLGITSEIMQPIKVCG